MTLCPFHETIGNLCKRIFLLVDVASAVNFKAFLCVKRPAGLLKRPASHR